ncbi:MAG: UDP-N-acetylglucosamine 4,6-dehydratase family protein [Candidatus Aenigmatarchaeota archaeon]
MNHDVEVFRNKKILITGGAGSIGSEIAEHLLEYEPAVIRILDNNEYALHKLKQKISGSNLRFFLGDIRDKERIERAMEGIDIVFHAAALKHVNFCEENPFEAIKTNVHGTQNVIEAALKQNAEKFITISTDKAANPVSVMGATKLLAEKLTVSANYYKGARRTALSCVRFGNVMESTGSVMPLFRQQIRKGGPITMTNPEMTRFMMSTSQAVDLILSAASRSVGREIFILKMNSVKIGDLAEAMIEEIAPICGYKPEEIKTEVIGTRPGEKMHEDLMTRHEAANAIETEDMFIIYPKPGDNAGCTNSRGLVSNDMELLTKDQIKSIIHNVSRRLDDKNSR